MYVEKPFGEHTVFNNNNNNLHTKHVFGEENHGIKREYQRFPADLGELRNHVEQTQSQQL